MNTKFLLIFLILGLSLISAKPKGRNKKEDSDPFEGLGDLLNNLAGLDDIQDLLDGNQDQLQEVDLKYAIRTDQKILNSIITAHIREYQETKQKRRTRFLKKDKEEEIEEEILSEIDKDLDAFTADTPEEAKKYLDMMLQELFKTVKHVKNFEQIMESDFVKNKNDGHILKLDTLIHEDQKELRKCAKHILEYFRHSLDPQTEEQHLEALDLAIDRVITYYVEERDLDEEKLLEIYKFDSKLNEVAFWVQQYLSNDQFQQAFDQVLQGNQTLDEFIDNLLQDDEVFEELFENENDQEQWEDITSRIAERADIDPDEITYMIDQYKREREEKERQKKIRKQEEENKKHDSTVLMVLGIIVLGITVGCGCRYLRKRKLERDSLSRQGGYHQEDM